MFQTLRNFQIARYLIINNADIEAKSLNGYTPLHKAAMENHVEIARLLVDAGCLLEEKNKWQRTPILQAAKNGQMEALKFLISKNCDLFAREGSRWTALHLAAMNPSIVNGKVAADFRPLKIKTCRKFLQYSQT
jgi:ankyrin repeat protein